MSRCRRAESGSGPPHLAGQRWVPVSLDRTHGQPAGEPLGSVPAGNAAGSQQEVPTGIIATSDSSAVSPAT